LTILFSLIHNGPLRITTKLSEGDFLIALVASPLKVEEYSA